MRSLGGDQLIVSRGMRLRGGAPSSGMLVGEGEGEGRTSDLTEEGVRMMEECFGPDTPGDSEEASSREVETQVGPEEYSAMVLWSRGRGLLMEKVNGKYRFVGGIFEVGDYPQPDCDTCPTEIALGSTEIIAGRELGSAFYVEELAIRHFAVKSWRGGGGRSGHAFRSRGGRLVWVQPDWSGGDVGLSDLWESAAHVWGAVHQYASHSSGARHIPL